MAKQAFEFDVTQARSITRNLFFYDMQERHQEIKTHFLYVSLKNLPKGLPTGINPRHADLKSKPCKMMFETLEREPELFTDCNRGLFLIAEKVYYPKPNDTKTIVIDFGTDEDGNVKGGLVDGNHSYRVLLDAANDETLSDLPVFITVIEGAQSFASKLARARNTSIQVQEKSMVNHEKEFDPLKDALGDYAKKIIWTQNENVISDEAVFPVEDLMALMTALNIELYDQDHHPTVAYTGTATCFNKWQNKKHRKTYEKLYPLMRSALQAYEHLYKNYKDYALQGGITRFGGYNGIETERGSGIKKRDVKTSLPFSGDTVPYKIANGFVLPIFASLRFLLETINEEYCWAIEPKEFLDKHGPKLVIKILEAHSAEYGSNPNKTGKSKVLWENVAQSVLNYSLQEKLTLKN